jgi:hypothetical protein
MFIGNAIKVIWVKYQPKVITFDFDVRDVMTFAQRRLSDLLEYGGRDDGSTERAFESIP